MIVLRNTVLMEELALMVLITLHVFVLALDILETSVKMVSIAKLKQRHVTCCMTD